jgi:hypothetical protein
MHSDRSKWRYKTSAPLKHAFFWNVTPCNSMQDPTFWRNVSLLTSGWKESVGQEQHYQELATIAYSYLLPILFLARSFFPTWWWRRYIPYKTSVLTEPYGGMPQKTVFVTSLPSSETNSQLWLLLSCILLVSTEYIEAMASSKPLINFPTSTPRCSPEDNIEPRSALESNRTIN